jgi:hypothetical protein
MDSEFVPRLDIIGCWRRLLVEALQEVYYSWLFLGGSEPDLQVGLVCWGDFDLQTADILLAGLLPFDGVAGANFKQQNQLCQRSPLLRCSV